MSKTVIPSNWNTFKLYKIQPPGGCKNITFYEAGKTYFMSDSNDSDPVLGKRGYHAYSSFRYYFDKPGYDSPDGNKYFEIEFLADATISSEIKQCACGKCLRACGLKMRVVRELSKDEAKDITDNSPICDFGMGYSPFDTPFKDLERAVKTKQVCKAAFEKDVKNLEFIPNKHKTKKMCMDGMRAHPYLVYSVPQRYHRDDTYIKHKAHVEKVVRAIKPLD